INVWAQIFSPNTSIIRTRIIKTSRKPISPARGMRSDTSRGFRSKTACAITCSGYIRVSCSRRPMGGVGASHSEAGYKSSFQEKLGRATDFRRKALVHGTIERGLLKDFPLRMIGRERDVNF